MKITDAEYVRLKNIEIAARNYIKTMNSGTRKQELGALRALENRLQESAQ